MKEGLHHFLKKFYHRAVPAQLRFRFRVFRRHYEYICLKHKELGFAEDGLYTFHTAPFLEEEKFQRAYFLGEQTGSWHGLSIRWRAYVACWAASHVCKLPGDFVECGVNRGGLARSIVDYLQFQQLQKRFFLIDTFAGLDPALLTETEREKGMEAIYSYYSEGSKAQVCQTFQDFKNVIIVQGRVPDILEEVPAEKVAFLSLDMNCTLPELRAAEFYWDRLSPGGIILLDDYGQSLHVEQRTAFDLFAAERGIKVLCLPTSQGLLFKPAH